MSIVGLESREAALAAFNPGLPARDVDARLRAALEDLQTAQRSAVLWFADVLNRSLYRELGYSSIHAYAAEALCFSRARTFYFLKLCRSLDALPALRESVASGALPWTKAVEVARIATPKTEGARIEAAQRVGRRDLARTVARAKARAKVVREADPAQTGLTLAGGDDADSPLVEAAVTEAPVPVTMGFTPEQYARYEALVERARKNGERGTREELLLAALGQLVNRAESRRVLSGSVESSRLDSEPNTPERRAETHERVCAQQPRYQVVVTLCPDCGRADAQTSRGPRALGVPALRAVLCDARMHRLGEKNHATIPPARRREVLARDGYRCRASGCESAHFLDVHHVIPREQGGTNDPANLITLCAPCHRLIHEQERHVG
jgi:hypothetical protein